MTSWLLGVLAVWLAAYAVACRWWPYTYCRRCRGDGKRRQPGNSRAWRTCPRCHATGRRLRIGRRLVNAMSPVAAQATAKEGTTR